MIVNVEQGMITAVLIVNVEPQMIVAGEGVHRNILSFECLLYENMLRGSVGAARRGLLWVCCLGVSSRCVGLEVLWGKPD